MKFVCDHMLGTLARWLRFLGYDTAYPGPLDDHALGTMANVEDRILLTRDRDLAARVPGASYVESDDPDEQLLEVARAYRLDGGGALSRCSVCNALIEPVPKEEARRDVPPGVYDRHEHFWHCRRCGRFYWQGSHFDRVLAKVRDVEARANDRTDAKPNMRSA